MHRLKLIIVLWFGILCSACVSVPENIKPVTGFDADRYLGTWYEIARLDHGFERGMGQVTATYTRRDDGGIDVLNKGFKEKSQVWKTAKGKAYFVDEPDIGHLKVSFFGPFYGSYVIFDLDDDYQQAFISGNSTKYLWLLARQPEISEDVRADFMSQASELGFDTDELIWVTQDAGKTIP